MALAWSNPAAKQQVDRVVTSLLTAGVGPTWAFAPKGIYAAGTTYAAGDVVTSVGIPYISQQASNTGKTPATNPAWWLPLYVEKLQAFDSKAAYAVGALVTSVLVAYACLNAIDGTGANTALVVPATDTTNWVALPGANGKCGLDLRELAAVGGSVELDAGEVFSTTPKLSGALLNPVTGQVNMAPDFDVTLTTALAGQGLPGWKIDGPVGMLLLVPSGLGTVHPRIALGGVRRPRIFSA